MTDERDHAAEPGDAKRTANLLARAALAGVAMQRLPGGSWLVSKWNLTREVADSEVEDWLGALEGKTRARLIDAEEGET